jgi:hypothetical protein
VKILVCGDRNWHDKEAVWWALYGFPKETELIHGACRGADMLADEVACELGWDTIYQCFADWEGFGKAAGPIRNQFMIDEHHPDIVLAFHSNIKESKGTRDMCYKAKKAGIPVIVIRSDKPAPEKG